MKLLSALAAATVLVGCASTLPLRPDPDPNWLWRWTGNPERLLLCSPQRAVLEEQWYLDRNCSEPPFRVVAMPDGSIIYGTCGGRYPGAVYDSMPEGGPCRDWEMVRAGLPAWEDPDHRTPDERGEIEFCRDTPHADPERCPDPATR